MTSVEEHDKENSTTIEVITIDDTPTTKKQKQNIDTFFSPPKKKFKQDKSSKNDETPKKEDKQDNTLISVDESAKENIPKDAKQSDKTSEEAGRTLAERQVSTVSKKKKSAKNIQTSKTNSSPKCTTNVSPKSSPKDVESAKNVKPAKNSPGVNKKDVKSGGITFNKLSKEDALKEAEKEAQVLAAKLKEHEEKDTRGITFSKLSKEDSLKEIEKEAEAQVLAVKLKEQEEKDTHINGEVVEVCDEQSDKGDAESPTPKKTEEKKTSPLSKERIKQKEGKEILKAARLKDMEEKRKKKEEEKLMKQAEKEKRDRLREEEKKKKEEDRKVKEEEKAKKDELLKMEKEKKDAEKEKKDAEKRTKEEQKRVEEEKKLQEDEAAKKKKEKEANHFRSFFTKRNAKAAKEVAVVETYQRFKPFQLKPDMELAPLVRKNNINKQLLDKTLDNEIADLDTYLKEQAIKLTETTKLKYISRRKARRELDELRKLQAPNKSEPRRRGSLQKKIEDNKSSPSIPAEVVVIEDNSNDACDADDDEDTENEEDENDGHENYLYTAKLLQFSENTRPSYYGTWRKKSSLISGKKPFAMDTGVFNYDIDSDEEWIDEPGENLSDVDDEDDKDDKEQEKETEDDQDGFFVPHGYLSDDEGINDQLDDEEENNTEETTVKNTEQNNEDKLKLKVCTFEQGFQKKLKHRKPICIGITYTSTIDTVNPLLKDYMKVALCRPAWEKEKEEGEEMEVASPTVATSEKKSPRAATDAHNTAKAVPEEAMPLLIKLLHGNTSGLSSMMEKFREYWSAYTRQNGTALREHISKKQLRGKIQSIASRVPNKDVVGKMCYVVKDETIMKYDVKDLKLGEGLPDLTNINNTSIQNENEAMETKDNENKIEPIECVESVPPVGTPMEVNS